MNQSVDNAVRAAARVATRKGKTIELTAREFRLLEYLVVRRSQVVSRSDIEAHIYPDAADLMSNTVDSAICILRKKLGLSGASTRIQTRRGMGYLIEDEPA